jgi:hypothetical protein
LPPSKHRTWQHLMDKQKDLQYAGDTQPDNNPDLENHDNDESQTVSDLPDQTNLGNPIRDVYGEDRLLPSRTTRSGRAYRSILSKTSHCCPDTDVTDIARPETVLCLTGIEPRGREQLDLRCPVYMTNMDHCSPSDPAHLQSSLFPGHEPQLTTSLVLSQTPPELGLPTRNVSFDTHRDVRLYQLGGKLSEYENFSQVCTDVETYISKIEPKVYLMASIASIDHSLKEVFYKASFTNPLANTMALELEEMTSTTE